MTSLVLFFFYGVSSLSLSFSLSLSLSLCVNAIYVSWQGFVIQLFGVAGPLVYGICFSPIAEKEKFQEMGFAGESPNCVSVYVFSSLKIPGPEESADL